MAWHLANDSQDNGQGILGRTIPFSDQPEDIYLLCGRLKKNKYIYILNVDSPKRSLREIFVFKIISIVGEGSRLFLEEFQEFLLVIIIIISQSNNVKHNLKFYGKTCWMKILMEISNRTTNDG